MAGEFGMPEPGKWNPSCRSSAPKRPRGDSLNGSDETCRDVLARAEDEGLRGDLSGLDSIEGMSVLVTGFVDGLSRKEVRARLEALGARCASKVSTRGKTDFVAVGPNASPGDVADAFEHRTYIVSTGDLSHLLARL